MNSCGVDDCSRQISCKSMCTLHYQRFRKNNGSIELRNKPAVCGHASKYKSGCRCASCKDAKSEESRIYRDENSEALSVSKKKWREDNPGKVRHYRKMYKQLVRGAPGSYLLDDWVAMKQMFGDRCVRCGIHESATEGLHADHVIPVSLGGSNSIDNIQPLCPRDNRSKGNRNSIDYRLVR